MTLNIAGVVAETSAIPASDTIHDLAPHVARATQPGLREAYRNVYVIEALLRTPEATQREVRVETLGDHNANALRVNQEVRAINVGNEGDVVENSFQIEVGHQVSFYNPPVTARGDRRAAATMVGLSGGTTGATAQARSMGRIERIYYDANNQLQVLVTEYRVTATLEGMGGIQRRSGTIGGVGGTTPPVAQDGTLTATTRLLTPREIQSLRRSTRAGLVGDILAELNRRREVAASLRRGSIPPSDGAARPAGGVSRTWVGRLGSPGGRSAVEAASQEAIRDLSPYLQIDFLPLVNESGVHEAPAIIAHNTREPPRAWRELSETELVRYAVNLTQVRLGEIQGVRLPEGETLQTTSARVDQTVDAAPFYPTDRDTSATQRQTTQRALGLYHHFLRQMGVVVVIDPMLLAQNAGGFYEGRNIPPLMRIGSAEPFHSVRHEATHAAFHRTGAQTLYGIIYQAFTRGRTAEAQALLRFLEPGSRPPTADQLRMIVMPDATHAAIVRLYDQSLALRQHVARATGRSADQINLHQLFSYFGVPIGEMQRLLNQHTPPVGANELMATWAERHPVNISVREGIRYDVAHPYPESVRFVPRARQYGTDWEYYDLARIMDAAADERAEVGTAIGDADLEVPQPTPLQSDRIRQLVWPRLQQLTTRQRTHGRESLTATDQAELARWRSWSAAGVLRR